jgi:hypothetical protein
MPWHTPRTWVHEELVSSDQFNEQIKDNLNYLEGISIPRMTTAERDAGSWTTGDTIFNTTENLFQVYGGSTWAAIGNPVANWMLYT